MIIKCRLMVRKDVVEEIPDSKLYLDKENCKRNGKSTFLK